MSTLPIAIVVWTAVAFLAFIAPRVVALIDESLPPFKEEDLFRYALFAVAASCLVGLVVLFSS